MRALQSADVILYDGLVSSDVLDFARREARKILVGETGHTAAIKLARQGQRVVQLRSSWPSEETAVYRAAGLAVETVPGITTV